MNRSQQARSLLALLAVAMLAACGASQRSAAPAHDEWRRYLDPVGWSIAYPGTMHVEQSEAHMRIDVWEVTVASFPMRTAVRSGDSWLRVDPPRDGNGAFPAAGVAFRIERMEGGPAPDVELPESRLPLHMSSFRRASDYPMTAPRPVERPVIADGRNYTALAWIGPQASPSLRSQLARVASSLSFPRLRTGARVGYGFSVLEPASAYPVGSFSRVRVQRQPFYLVRAPGGFYAIGWRWETLSGGYKSRCALQLDELRKEFVCRNIHARWDRVGRVLAKPVSAERGDPLNVAVAKIGWDGHVLLFPGSARFADAAYARRLWPHWD